MDLVSAQQLTAAWVSGGWVPEESCESDAGVIYDADGTWKALDSSGTWRLEGRQILTMVTAADRDGGEPVKVDPPINHIFSIETAGPDEMLTRDEKGSTRALQRCVGAG